MTYIEIEKIVPDTSILVSRLLSDLIEKKEIKKAEIIISEFVLEELRAQASRGRETGFMGLEEIKRLRGIPKSSNITIRKIGRRQTLEEIQLAKYGRIDALILDIAKQENATLYTSDMVQSLVAEAEGIKTRYFKPYEKNKNIKLSELMTDKTMSLHMKEGTLPRAKIGVPGDFKLVKIRKTKVTTEEIEGIIKEVMDAARYEEDSFVEIGGHSATVVQLGNMRISITRPPFSDGIEVTVVRPIVKLTLDDYKMSDKLKKRLTEKIDGVLIAGPPGSGKSTFAASLAEFFEENNFIVKTMESPRDLQVKPEITQYSKLRGSFENTADLLLLVRPDYTVFDEVRKTEEFITFSDMRLSGIGMLGVVHATDPVDAIQRFIGRIELGIIPHIIDTVIFIEAGKIKKIYCLSMVVRTPTGMNEADLARPIVEIRDFETNKLEYEVYTYGEENVIIPVKDEKSSLTHLAKKEILREIMRFDRHAEIESLSEDKVIIKVSNDALPKIIGRKGSTIKELENKLGLSIDVSPKVSMTGGEIAFNKEETGTYFVFTISEKPGKLISFYGGQEFIFSAILGKNSHIRVSKDSETGKKVMNALLKDELKVFA